MSSLASARASAATGSPRAARRIDVLGVSVSADAAVGGLLALALVLVAFTTKSGIVQGSGLDLGANTWLEIILTLLGGAAVAAVLLLSARGPASGAGALLAFAASAVLTAVSIAWSVQPDASWTAANQAVAYLGAFGAAIAAARLFPFRWAPLAGALAPAAVVVGGYALLAKVFPALPDGEGSFGRLTAPLGYWNALGLLAAMGLPGCLWIGSRRANGALARALSVPAITVLGAVVVLSYSRSAVAAAVVGLACFLGFVPGRLRAAALLLPGLMGAGLLSAWFLAHHALADNGQPLGARTAAGHDFGLVLVVVLVLATTAGATLATRGERVRLGAAARRRIAIGLLVLAGLVPVGGVVALASSSRGLTGEISHVWSTLTSTQTHIGSQPGRLTALANSRPRYWRDAVLVGKHHLLAGAGALGYATARTRYTAYFRPVQSAHGYLFETFADFGLIGLALTVLLLGAWGRAVLRTLRRPSPPSSAPAADSGRESAAYDAFHAQSEQAMALEDERAGLITLLSVVVAFGVHSAIDWTWFIPVTALPALACAGWLAGRGPLPAPVGRLARRRRLLSHPALPLAVTGVAVVTAALLWAIWQPLRSAQASDAAVAAAARGDATAALADARAAVSRDPLSLSALSLLSSLAAVDGRLGAARRELVTETLRQPDNYVAWVDLGCFDLLHANPRRALGELVRAQGLDPFDWPAETTLGAARAGAHPLSCPTR